MKLFKTCVAASFILLGSQMAFADSPAVEHYTYSTQLDIAKVIDEDPIPNVCGVVPITMTYLDHQGQQHILQYSVFGNGCSDS